MIKIKINQEEYFVTITKKRIKNINLKIDEQNRIAISCPLHMQEQEVLTFLDRHREWLTKRIVKNNKNKQQFIHLQDEKIVYLLGKEYLIVTTKSLDKHLQIEDDVIYFASKKSFYSFYHDYLINRAKELCEEKGVEATIKVKRYRSRWGCCKYRTKEIYLNEKLIALPKDFIDYVIYHEISHLIVPNHSPSFYKTLALSCPDYKKYKKEIKKYRLTN